jgi:hypothetical protein
MNQVLIFVAIACHNRRRVAELCLPTMRDSVDSECVVGLYDDASTEYDAEWLRQFSPSRMAVSSIENHPIGIQAMRRTHLMHFLITPGLTHIYLSDHDMLMDYSWKEQALRLQAKYDGKPLCLYDTTAHSKLPGNTIKDDSSSEVIWRRVAPGCSYLLTRKHVEVLAPHIATLQHFDWTIPALLGSCFAISRICYCDHVGWGGDRHPPNSGLDGGDRALNPTPWLVAKRAEVVAKLAP